MKIAVIGEGVIDRFVDESGHRDVLGGSALNAAVALARSGVPCTWFGRMSRDAEGESLVAYAQAEGVAAGVVRVEEPASIVTVMLAQGSPTYEFALAGASDWGWQTAELSGLSSFDLIQVNSLTAVLEPSSTHLFEYLNSLRNSVSNLIVSYDPNARPRAASTETEAEAMKARIERYVKLANFVKVSDEDLEWIRPDHSPTQTAELWSTWGPAVVIMTRGASGAVAYIDGQEVASIPGVTIELVDTVGAGDTFMAWLLRGIHHLGHLPTTHDELVSVMSVAARAAAITCSRPGCQPPYEDEVAR